MLSAILSFITTFPAGGLAAELVPEVVLRYRSVGEFLPGHLVAPVPESALGELHDVPLVHYGDRLYSLVYGVLYGLSHEPLRSEGAYGLYSYARAFPYVDPVFFD